MTAPRQILRGATYLVTRRCAQRQFLLKPCAATNETFLYVLAVAVKKFGIDVHAYCVLSNHFHLVVTDRDATLPAFEQYLDSLVARAVNASLGRSESFWGPSSYSAVTLVSPDDVVAKAAYTLANPVAAGLVRRGREWPGLWSDPEAIGGRAIEVTRPRSFFRAKGRMPERVELELKIPPGFASAPEFRNALAVELAALEARAASEHRKFAGQRKVLAQDPMGHPAPEKPRGVLNPKVAGRDKWKRIEALERLVAFLRSYRIAWRALREGVRDVLFPEGTYLLRIMHGVRCAPA